MSRVLLWIVTALLGGVAVLMNRFVGLQVLVIGVPLLLVRDCGRRSPRAVVARARRPGRVTPVLRDVREEVRTEPLLLRAPRAGGLRSDPRVLAGSTGLHRIDWDARRFEIGYWVRRRFAGQGFATEAARGMAMLALRELGAQRLGIWCDARNTRKPNVALRLGFRLEGTLRERHRTTDASLGTDHVFGLLRAEAGQALGSAIAADPAGASSPG